MVCGWDGSTQEGASAAGLCVLTASRRRRSIAPPAATWCAPIAGQGAAMATHAKAELRADVHRIEPIPEADKDSTGPQQMWIWAGANIAPINWALGALGNLVGCAIFAGFTVMGHKTGVNQMVLQRSAFGRRGAYLPSALMFLMTLGWIG